MKVVEYEHYKAKRSELLRLRARLDIKRAPSRRKRDGKERELLLYLNKTRWERWLTEGKLKKTAKRVYEFT